MPTTVQVQTDHYTDDGSHPVKFLIGNFQGQYTILDSQIPVHYEAPSIRHDFDCVFFDSIEGWQLLVPKSLCVFIGRCAIHRGYSHDWWTFKGEITTVEIPGWGEL